MRCRAWMKSGLCFTLIGFLGGCAAGSAGSVDGEISETKVRPDKKVQGSKTLGDLGVEDDHEVRLWQWTRGGEFLVLYGDGLMGRVSLSGKSAPLAPLVLPGTPGGFSLDGNLAWVDVGAGTTIVEVSDAPMMLPLNEVGRLEHVAASADSAIVYGAEPGGDLHVWRDMGGRLRMPETNLETLVERQLPDATAHLGVASPIFVASRGELLFGDATGRLTRWHVDDPQAITRLAELGAPLRGVAEGNDFYVATARNDRLSVVDMEYGENAWSENAKAQWASASPRWPNRAVVIADGKLSALDAKTGDVQWSVPMPAGEVCGLSVSQDGRSIAVCIGNQFAIVSRDDGALMNVVARDGEGLKVK